MPHRTFDPPQSPLRTASTAMRARPVTKLRTIVETAEIFSTSSRTVRRLINSGALPVHHLGRSVRISDADIAAFLAANRSV
jgi:excisionase family DNA binding protein